MRPQLSLILASLALTSLTAFTPALPAESPSQPELLARLTTAREASDLTTPGLKPWHLKATFSLRDLGTTTEEQGTLEEWWASPDHWRLQVISPTYTSVLTSEGDKVFRSRSAGPLPLAIGTLHQQLTAPLQGQADFAHAKLFFESKALAGIKLDSILVDPATGKELERALYPAFYFDPGDTNLRAIKNGNSFILRNQSGQFQHKAVALQVVISEDGKPLLTAAVAQLSTFTPSPTDFQPATEQEALPPRPAANPGGLEPWTTLHKVPPSYPALARRDHVFGAVVLKCVIGADGQILSLTPVSSPSKLLTDAAVTAVHQWRYTPYLFNGIPTSVETTVTVHFNMGL